MIIGLDVATTTGIAVGDPGSKPLCWSECFGKTASHDIRFSEALKLTKRLIDKYQPRAIFLEAPILKRRDKKANLVLLFGLQASIRAWAQIKGVPCKGIEIPTMDKHFIGMSGMKSKDRKDAIAARCRQLGWTCPDQDSADAAAIWDYGCSLQSRAHSLATSPLFGGV